MATLKVGMRVRVARLNPKAKGEALDLAGQEGVIVAPYTSTAQLEWVVDVPAVVATFGKMPRTHWLFASWELEPLLPPDPGADAFLARIKKLGSEPVNDAPKVKVEAK